MRRSLFLSLVGLCLFSTTAVMAAVPTEEKPIAVLRALDKITARVEALEVTVEQPMKFGTLILTVHNCRVSAPEETPEAAAFLEISEIKNGESETPRFKGWMYASSPALSALEHPIYDIWVTGCKTLQQQQAEQTINKAPAPVILSALKK